MRDKTKARLVRSPAALKTDPRRHTMNSISITTRVDSEPTVELGLAPRSNFPPQEPPLWT